MTLRTFGQRRGTSGLRHRRFRLPCFLAGAVNEGPPVGRREIGVAKAGMAGQVARNVQAGKGTLRLDEHAVVGGNLTYSSDQTAQIAP